MLEMIGTVTAADLQVLEIKLVLTHILPSLYQNLQFEPPVCQFSEEPPALCRTEHDEAGLLTDVHPVVIVRGPTLDLGLV